jgi:hypothetical protein
LPLVRCKVCWEKDWTACSALRSFGCRGCPTSLHLQPLPMRRNQAGSKTPGTQRSKAQYQNIVFFLYSFPILLPFPRLWRSHGHLIPQFWLASGHLMIFKITDDLCNGNIHRSSLDLPRRRGDLHGNRHAHYLLRQSLAITCPVSFPPYKNQRHRV